MNLVVAETATAMVPGRVVVLALVAVAAETVLLLLLPEAVEGLPAAESLVGWGCEGVCNTKCCRPGTHSGAARRRRKRSSKTAPAHPQALLPMTVAVHPRTVDAAVGLAGAGVEDAMVVVWTGRRRIPLPR